jgi:putative transposase
VRNKCLRFWIDGEKVKPYDLNKHCAVLAQEFEFARKLNSQARQAAAERAAFAIKRFYDNCKTDKANKGYPKFQKDNRSAEYKTTGWKLSDDRKRITFTDGCGIGTLKMCGTRDLHWFDVKQFKRVRIVRMADGYYVQFCIEATRKEAVQPSGVALGIDVGLLHFYTDSQGRTVEAPKCLRKGEKKLKRLHRRVSRKAKGSTNRSKARKVLGRGYLKVTRQRKDFAVKTARCVVKSNDFIAFEDLQIANMVQNHSLAKSIHDAAWGQFISYTKYFGTVFGKVVVAVPPHYTSQDCSGCGERVQKTLSARTHQCPKCGLVLDRDHNGAINILSRGLEILNQTETTAGHAERKTLGETVLDIACNATVAEPRIPCF